MNLISSQWLTSLLRGRLIIYSWRKCLQGIIKKYRCTFQIRTNLSSFSKRWVYWKKGFRSKTVTWEIEWRLSSFLKTINQSMLRPKVSNRESSKRLQRIQLLLKTCNPEFLKFWNWDMCRFKKLKDEMKFKDKEWLKTMKCRLDKTLIIKSKSILCFWKTTLKKRLCKLKSISQIGMIWTRFSKVIKLDLWMGG
jgi:hypothetical protein